MALRGGGPSIGSVSVDVNLRPAPGLDAQLASIGRAIGNRLQQPMAGHGERAGSIFTGRFAQTVHRASGVVDRVVGTMGRVIQGGLTAVGVVAGAALGTAIVGGFQRLGNLDMARHQMQAMGLSASQTEGLINELDQRLMNTSVSLDESTDAMKRMITAGTPMSDVVDRVEMMADAAAFANVPLGEVTNIFERITSEGKITGETLRMLQVRGIPALQLLADAAGVSEEQMREMISAGMIDTETFFELWEKGSKGFGDDQIRIAGAAEALADTLSGSITNLRTFLSRAGAGFLETSGIFDFVKTSIRAVSDVIADSLPHVDNLGEAFGRWAKIEEATKWMENLDEHIGNLSEKVKGLSDGAKGVLGAMAGLAAALGLVAASSIGAVRWFLPFAAVLGGTVGVVIKIVAALLGFILTNEELRGKFGELLEAMAPLFVALGETLVELVILLAEALIPVLIFVMEGLIRVFTWLGERASWVAPLIIGVALGIKALSIALHVGAALHAMIKAIAVMIPLLKIKIGLLFLAAKAKLALAAAFLATPLGWITLLIIALVAAVIYAWNNFDWFRDAVVATWDAISAAAVWLFETILKPAFNWLVDDGLPAVGGAFSWLWTEILQPIFSGIGTVLAWLWENVLGPVFRGFAWLLTEVVGPAIVWLWQNIIQPAFSAIGAVVLWLWENIIKESFEGWRLLFVHVIGPAIVWLAESVVAPMFRLIGRIAIWLWENVLQPAWQGFVFLLTNLVFPTIAFLWRNIVSPMFTAIGRLAMWLWNNAIKPSFHMIWWIIQNVVGPVVVWLWRNVVGPMFRAIGALAVWLWEKAIGPAFRAIGAVAVWLWENAFRPAFRAIGAIVRWLWNNIIDPIFSAIGSLIRWVWENLIEPALVGWKKLMDDDLGPVIEWLWNDIIEPVFRNVGNFIRSVWRRFIKPVFDAFIDIVKAIGRFFKEMWEDEIKPAWRALRRGLKAGWDWVVEKVWDPAKKLVTETIPGWFSDMKDKVVGFFEDIWDRIKEIWDKITDLVSNPLEIVGDVAGGIKDFLGFASGGLVSGPGGPRSDAILARLSDGEFVVQAAAVKKYGASLFAALNSGRVDKDRLPGFATGGLVGSGSDSGGSGGSGTFIDLDALNRMLDNLPGFERLAEVLGIIVGTAEITASAVAEAVASIIDIDNSTLEIANTLADGLLAVNDAVILAAGSYSTSLNEMTQSTQVFAEQLPTIYTQMFERLRTSHELFSADTVARWRGMQNSISTSLDAFVSRSVGAWQRMQNSIISALSGFVSQTTSMWRSWQSDLNNHLDRFTSSAVDRWVAWHTRMRRELNSFIDNTTTRWEQWQRGLFRRLDSFTSDVISHWRDWHRSLSRMLNSFANNTYDRWDDWLRALSRRWRSFESTQTSEWRDWHRDSRRDFGRFAGSMEDRWDDMWSDFRSSWRSFRPTVTRDIPDAFDEFRRGSIRTFRDTAEGIGDEWNKIRRYTRDPVRFVVVTVFNRALRNLFTAAARIFDDMPSFRNARLPRGFAKGGIYPGYTPGRDVGLAAVSGGEAIMRPEWTRVVGPSLINEWNQVARQRGVRGLSQYMGNFFTGGIVDSIVSRSEAALRGARKLDPEDYFENNRIERAGKTLERGIDRVPDGDISHMARRTGVSMWDFFLEKMVGMVGAVSGGDGGDTGTGSSELLQAMAGFVRKAASGMRVSSGYRPGDPGYHGRQRAIDMVFSDGSQNRSAGQSPAGQAGRAASAITQAFMGNTLELIWDPLGNRGIWNGKFHRFTGGGAGPGTHNDHIHWAFGGSVDDVRSGRAGGGGEWGDGGAYEAADFGKRRKATGLFEKAKEAAKQAMSLAGGLVDADGSVIEQAYAQAKAMLRNHPHRRKLLESLMMAGWVESRFQTGPRVRNKDHDSAGFLQQRPSMGWGTLAQVENVPYATREFLKRAMAIVNRNPGISPAALAQAVQRSAFPGRYAQARAQARAAIRSAGGWFDKGGLLQPGVSTVVNDTGKPEVVLTASQWNAIASLAADNDRDQNIELNAKFYLDGKEIDARVELMQEKHDKDLSRRLRARRRT